MSDTQISCSIAKKTPSTVILGAGLSGLSYAYSALRKGSSVIILEKDDKIGGLMKTFEINGFLFDFGPHIFRSGDRTVFDFAKDLLYNNHHNISSNPCIFKEGVFFDNVIPVITYRNIESLPEEIRDKVKEEIRNSNRILNLDNFETCIISQIGETLYWEFFGEYSKKWWGIDPKYLSSDIAPKNLTIGSEKFYTHITTNFKRPSEEIYPTKGGIFEIIRRMEERVKALGGSILTTSNIRKLECDGDMIGRVVVERNEEEVEINTSNKLVVSTIPLTKLCEMLEIENSLIFRGDICIFIKLKGSRMLNASWVYIHDPDIIFSRIHEPLYFSENNSPKGYTSLCIEVTSFDGDGSWRDKYLGEKVLDQLIDLGIVKRNQEPEILGMEKCAHAYPVYTINYKKELEKVFRRLGSFKNLKVIGRSGSFNYLNMWQCLRWAVR